MSHLGITLVVAAAGLLMSACQTYTVARYSVSADNVERLRSLQKKYPQASIRVANFEPGLTPLREVTCRGAGPILTPDHKTFAQYLQSALVNDMQMAGVYSDQSSVSVAAEVRNLDFSSMSGTWSLSALVEAGAEPPFEVLHQSNFETSFWNGDNACAQTAQAFMPAVQDFLRKILSSQQFEKAFAASAAQPAATTAKTEEAGVSTATADADVAIDAQRPVVPQRAHPSADVQSFEERLRIALALQLNASSGGDGMRFATAGARNTTFVVEVERLIGSDDAAKRQFAESILEIYGRKSESAIAAGFTHLLVRDRETGLEIERPFNEVTPHRAPTTN